MSPTTTPPPTGPPGPPSGRRPDSFAGMVTVVDATGPADGAKALVSAIAASQQGINHLQGRKLQLTVELYVLYRNQLLLEDLDEDELRRLTGTSQGGMPRDTAASTPTAPERATDERAVGDKVQDNCASDVASSSDVSATRNVSARSKVRAEDVAGAGSDPSQVDLVRRGLELSLFGFEDVREAEKCAARMVAAELAVALGLSPREAASAVRRWVAWSLSTPVVVDALAQGELDMDKAVVIAAATRVLNDTSDVATADTRQGTAPDPSEQADQHGHPGDESTGAGAPVSLADRVASEVISRAPSLSRRQVGDLTDTLVLEQDPLAAEKRHRREVGYRGLELKPGIECTATLEVTGAPADRAVAAYNRIDAIARRTKAAGDDRSLHQLRCDLSLALMTGDARFELVDPDDRSGGNVREAAADGASPAPTRSAGGGSEPSTATRVEAKPGATRRSAVSGQLPAPASRSSVGCDCAPGRACRCECGTGYADPADLAHLEQSHRANETARAIRDAGTARTRTSTTAHGGGSRRKPGRGENEPNAMAGTTETRASGVAARTYLVRPSTPPDAGAAPEMPSGAVVPTELEVFPVVPVAPGEVPGRASALPGTILTVPLETVLGWSVAGPESPAATVRPDPRSTGTNGIDTNSAGRNDTGPRAAGTNDTDQRGPGTAETVRGTRSVSNSRSANLPAAWMEKVGPLVDSLAERVITARLAQAERDATGEFRIAVTDKQGRVVQYHAVHARTLRGLLREAVAVDYGTCVFPTCSTPALRCQADHATEYAVVRSTRIGNIEPLCGADHGVKSAGGYRIERANPHDAGSPATWQLAMRSGQRHALTTVATRLSIGTVASKGGITAAELQHLTGWEDRSGASADIPCDCCGCDCGICGCDQGSVRYPAGAGCFACAPRTQPTCRCGQPRAPAGKQTTTDPTDDRPPF